MIRLLQLHVLSFPFLAVLHSSKVVLRISHLRIFSFVLLALKLVGTQTLDQCRYYCPAAGPSVFHGFPYVVGS
jgi:hypothetical protein